VRRGWCLGSEGFRREMLLRMEGKLGEHHSGELHRASAEAKAERIIAQELQRQGWQEADLLARRKSDAVKLEIAARLRRETMPSTKAIAARMHLGEREDGQSELAPLYTWLRSRQPGTGPPGDMTSTHNKKGPSYGLTPFRNPTGECATSMLPDGFRSMGCAVGA